MQCVGHDVLLGRTALIKNTLQPKGAAVVRLPERPGTTEPVLGRLYAFSCSWTFGSSTIIREFLLALDQQLGTAAGGGRAETR